MSETPKLAVEPDRQTNYDYAPLPKGITNAERIAAIRIVRELQKALPRNNISRALTHAWSLLEACPSWNAWEQRHERSQQMFDLQ